MKNIIRLFVFAILGFLLIGCGTSDKKLIYGRWWVSYAYQYMRMNDGSWNDENEAYYDTQEDSPQFIQYMKDQSVTLMMIPNPDLSEMSVRIQTNECSINTFKKIIYMKVDMSRTGIPSTVAYYYSLDDNGLTIHGTNKMDDMTLIHTIKMQRLE